MYGSVYTVSDVMTRSVVALAAGAGFKDIVRTMRTQRISALPVIDAGNRVVGVVSEADLLRKEELRDSDQDVHPRTGPVPAHDKARGVTATDLMTSPPSRRALRRPWPGLPASWRGVESNACPSSTPTACCGGS